MAISIAISDMLLCNGRGLLRPCDLVAATVLAIGVWVPDLALANDPVVPASPQISLEDLSATRDRPLFSPSRRPPASNVIAVAVAPPQPPAPPPVPLPAPNLTFLGTFESPTEVGAAVQIPPNDKPTIVRYGTIINGWRVVDISHRKLTLAVDDRKTVFTLFDPKNPNGEPSNTAPTAPQFHPAPAITPAPAPQSAR
jgi:hypothetical protein